MLVVVDDLMTGSRIEATAHHLGYEVHFARTVEDFWRGVDDGAALVLVGTHQTRLAWEALVSELTARPGAPAVLAFGSHVDAETRDHALAAGVSRWVPNSVLATRLPELIPNMTRGPKEESNG